LALPCTLRLQLIASPLAQRALRASKHITIIQDPSTSDQEVLGNWDPLMTAPDLFPSLDTILPAFLELLPKTTYTRLVERVVDAWWAVKSQGPAQQLPGSWPALLMELHLLVEGPQQELQVQVPGLRAMSNVCVRSCVRNAWQSDKLKKASQMAVDKLLWLRQVWGDTVAAGRRAGGM
jgi:hypothetical protein